MQYIFSLVLPEVPSSGQSWGIFVSPSPVPSTVPDMGQMLINQRMNGISWLAPLCWEAGLEADVSVSPNGQRKPKVSKIEFAQGSVMGIRIMMAMIIIT